MLSPEDSGLQLEYLKTEEAGLPDAGHREERRCLEFCISVSRSERERSDTFPHDQLIARAGWMTDLIDCLGGQHNQARRSCRVEPIVRYRISGRWWRQTTAHIMSV